MKINEEEYNSNGLVYLLTLDLFRDADQRRNDSKERHYIYITQYD